MTSALTIISVAAFAYVATNLDNFTLLVSLLSRYRRNRVAVAAAYFAGTAILCAAGFLIGEAAETAPLEYLGLLGVIPMTIGIVWLVRLFRPAGKPPGAETSGSAGKKAAFAATLTTQLGNGTDTIVTFGALFADSTASADYLIVLTVALMAVLFVTLALYGVSHSALGSWIDRYMPRIAPFILIVVGAYIIANTATDVMPG